MKKNHVTFTLIVLAISAAVALSHAQSDPVFLDLQASRAHYATPMPAAERGALLNEVAFRHPGVGLQKKTSGDTCPQPVTGISIACDILRFPGNVGRDVLQDAEGAGKPDWGAPGPADPATFVAPVDPGGVIVEPPPPPPPDLTARVVALEAELVAMKVQGAGYRAALSELQARVTALESKPAPGLELPRMRVKGQTGRSLGHSHAFTADVEIVR